jgi:hypothetical protein
MEGDLRLNSQLKSLGKKLFQFRDLVSKIDIPETLPPPPNDRMFWDVFVKKCASAATVLNQVQAALTPDLYHLAVHPGSRIWRNPAAVPDLLGMPDLVNTDSPNPVASTIEEVMAWNAAIEEALRALEEFEDSHPSTIPKLRNSHLPNTNSPEVAFDKDRISSLFNSKSTDRVLATPLG